MNNTNEATMKLRSEATKTTKRRNENEETKKQINKEVNEEQTKQ